MRKEKVKFSLFVEDMILYIEKPKDAIEKLLDLINKFNKVAEDKINIRTSVAFLYTDNEMSKKERKKQPMHNSTKNNKIFWNKFNQGSKSSVH